MSDNHYEISIVLDDFYEFKFLYAELERRLANRAVILCARSRLPEHEFSKFMTDE